MWSVTQICRCSHSIRSVQSKILYNVGPRLNSRALVVPTRYTRVALKNTKGLRISEYVKSFGIVARFSSNGVNPKSSKAVGYWLLGCSGMVFTAVVLGMVAGYIIMLYSIYYVINVILKTTNGGK